MVIGGTRRPERPKNRPASAASSSYKSRLCGGCRTRRNAGDSVVQPNLRRTGEIGQQRCRPSLPQDIRGLFILVAVAVVDGGERAKRSSCEETSASIAVFGVFGTLRHAWGRKLQLPPVALQKHRGGEE